MSENRKDAHSEPPLLTNSDDANAKPLSQKRARSEIHQNHEDELDNEEEPEEDAYASSNEQREINKQEMLRSDRHWILHELTYPSKREVTESTLKQHIWLLFEDPTSSQPAYVLSVTIMAMIVISGISFLIETIPGNQLNDNAAVQAMEYFFVICFTVEYALRLLSCPHKREFLLSFLNLIDLFAFLPFYVELVIPNSASATPILRVVRLTRVFRIMKVSKYVTWIRVFTSAIQKSIRPLAMLLYIMFIGIVLCSTAMYFVEKDVINPQTKLYPFQSIPSAFWWSIITMTTVGYGDAVPQTAGGKVIGAITSLCGILVLALPITVISSNFNNEMEKMKRVQETPVQSIQTLRKLLDKRYKRLIREKQKLLKHGNAASAVALDEEKHVQRQLENDASSIQFVSNAREDTLSIVLSPKARTKLSAVLSPHAADDMDKHNEEDADAVGNEYEKDVIVKKSKHILSRLQKASDDESADMDADDDDAHMEPGTTMQVTELHDLLPYLSNEEIRGILASHIVQSLVTLIEKEEKSLKRKFNELIRTQFDFLLSDISRIFSEIPHFHGLNTQDFTRNAAAARRKPSQQK